MFSKLTKLARVGNATAPKVATCLSGGGEITCEFLTRC
jgi:hypothetical protein